MNFVLWAKKFRTLPEKYGRVSETSIYVSGEKLWERKIWKNDDILVILYFERKKLNSGQSNLAGVVKAAFGVSRGIFWAFFIGKTMIFEWFSDFERKKSGIRQNFTADFRNFNLRVRWKIYVSGEKFREKKNEKKRWFPGNFVLWVKRKLDCGQNSLARVVKDAFDVSTGIFWAFFIEKTMILEWISYFERKNSGLCQKSTAGSPKLQSTCQEKNCEREKFEKWWYFGNFVLWAKKIELWAKQFGRGCQSCIWRVQRNLLSIFHWKNDDFWMIFGLWAKKIRNSPKFYGRFPKLQSTCPEKKFERQKMKKKDDFLVILYS